MTRLTTVPVQAPSGPAGFTDAFSLGVKASDANAAPTDLGTFGLDLLLADAITTQTETAKLGISGTGFSDASAVPTDLRSVTMKIWLSGGTATANGVTNVANSNGQNDAAVATIQSAVAGVTTPRITSVLGANVPSGLVISAAIYRGWFRSVNTLVSSSGKLILHSLTALFADIEMFSNAALNTTVDRLDGSFTFDLVAAGINTQAKLQDIQMYHQTTDAAAGVTPHVLTVDAGCIELAGAF